MGAVRFVLTHHQTKSVLEQPLSPAVEGHAALLHQLVTRIATLPLLYNYGVPCITNTALQQSHYSTTAQPRREECVQHWAVEVDGIVRLLVSLLNLMENTFRLSTPKVHDACS